MSDVNKGGRPTTYTPELGDLVCELVSTHDCGLEELCETYKDIMPAWRTIYQWRWKQPEFAQKYNEAKRQQHILMAEKLNHFMAAALKDYGYIDKNGVMRIDGGVASLVKMESDVRKWTIARTAQKEYGDKHQLEVNDVTNHEDRLKQLRDE